MQLNSKEKGEPGSVGFVALLCGELYVRDESGALRQAAEWEPLFRNEKLICNDECATAVIMLGNGRSVRVEPNSELILDDDMLGRY